ncbi:TorF family putative porin [Sphingomonas glaciei]|uniref:TorF family putative porin n=1 Tax=Sphingomonas glaciei TaxID=2938948 RepID=A0ABY5MV16_9SPHN|nr:TorF family putative porin [Sphingomonas glaciei]UUR07157.1 TorF family putative porin [Sphingomonas glaciei]
MRVFDLLTTAAILAAAFPVRAAAQEAPAPAFAVSGGTTLVSRYRFRGIGLSDEMPTVQGTINLAHRSGAYVGAWASELDGFGELGGTNLELDLYGGYKLPVGKATLDAGLLYYAYPGSKGGKFEFFEPYANLSLPVGPATAKLGFAFAPEQAAIGGNSNVYLFNDNSLPLKGTPLTLTSHVGWSRGRTTLTPGGDYLDWSLGAQASWRNLTAGVAYVDTDISRRDALAAGATKGIVDSTAVLSLGASF